MAASSLEEFEELVANLAIDDKQRKPILDWFVNQKKRLDGIYFVDGREIYKTKYYQVEKTKIYDVFRDKTPSFYKRIVDAADEMQQ